MRDSALGSGIRPDPAPTVLVPLRNLPGTIPGTLPVRLPDGRLPARTRVPVPHRKSPVRYLPVVLGVLCCGAVGTLAVLLVWAVVSVVAWLVAHLVVIGAVLVALVLLGCLVGRSACEGIHCSGCRR